MSFLIFDLDPDRNVLGMPFVQQEELKISHFLFEIKITILKKRVTTTKRGKKTNIRRFVKLFIRFQIFVSSFCVSLHWLFRITKKIDFLFEKDRKKTRVTIHYCIERQIEKQNALRWGKKSWITVETSLIFLWSSLFSLSLSCSHGTLVSNKLLWCTLFTQFS